MGLCSKMVTFCCCWTCALFCISMRLAGRSEGTFWPMVAVSPSICTQPFVIQSSASLLDARLSSERRFERRISIICWMRLM